MSLSRGDLQDAARQGKRNRGSHAIACAVLLFSAAWMPILFGVTTTMARANDMVGASGVLNEASGLAGSEERAVRNTPAEETIPPDTFIALDRLPAIKHQEKPEYPRLAEEAGFEGTVMVKAYVDKEGMVKKAEIIKSDREGIGFRESALKAAYMCTYSPGIRDGKPVGAWISYKVIFKLDDKKKDKK